jgi:pimeloyl-ACP methyl ester carboxylesterase
VGKLVLDATLPGDGQAVLPSSQVIAELNHPSDPAATLALLFPPDAAGQAASATYVSGILSYPDYHQAPAAAVAAQSGALASWALGSEAAGKDLAAVAVPTLVADGSADTLIPEANDAHLAAVIPGAQLVIYPGASHAFMFQDQDQYLPRLVSFLG